MNTSATLPSTAAAAPPVPQSRPATPAPVLAAPAPSLDDLVAATPADRDRVVDAVRAVAIVAVVLGHYLVAAPVLGPDGIEAENLLGRWFLGDMATWAFQVMPLFFVVGGVANAASLRSARRTGRSSGAWLRSRFRRLLAPTLPFVALWTGAAVTARLAGIDAELVQTAAHLAVVPLWFLAAYVIVTAMVPLTVAAHDRRPVAMVGVLAGATVAVDLARALSGSELVGYLNFVFCYGLAQQLGYWWLDRRLPGTTRGGLMLAAAGLGATVVAVVGPYPLSMVGVPGGASNSAPPTLALALLGVFHLGVVTALRPHLATMLERPRVWKAVIVMNARAMSIYLWHITVLIAAAGALIGTGVWPHTELAAIGTGPWWVWRMVFVALLVLGLVVLVGLVGRWERPTAVSEPSDPGTHRLVAATALFAVAFLAITTQGLSPHGWPLGLPLPALAALSAATLLTTGRPRQS